MEKLRNRWPPKTDCLEIENLVKKQVSEGWPDHLGRLASSYIIEIGQRLQSWELVEVEVVLASFLALVETSLRLVS